MHKNLEKKMAQTSQALHIVLQHCMLPNLGWYPDACENHIRTLREEILTHQTQIFQQDSAQIHSNTSLQSETRSPYDFIAADEIEKNSSKYLQLMLSLFDHNDNNVDVLMQPLPLYHVS
jgi:uncharacterized membrane protein YcgQ (UPF0703/DUF1980 family)